MKAEHKLIFISSLFLFFTGSCQQKINLAELIIDADGYTAATPPYDPDRAIPPHLSMNKDYAPVMVDPGVINLALNKPVTASEDPMNGEPEQLTDDIKSSGIADFIEGPAWVQVDLKEPASIHAIVVWHYYEFQDIYDDVIVRVSNDPDFRDSSQTLFNNDHNNSSGLGFGKDSAYISSVWGNIIDARDPDSRGTVARYVRVHTGKSSVGDPPRYLELAVYGFRF